MYLVVSLHDVAEFTDLDLSAFEGAEVRVEGGQFVLVPESVNATVVDARHSASVNPDTVDAGSSSTVNADTIDAGAA